MVWVPIDLECHFELLHFHMAMVENLSNLMTKTGVDISNKGFYIHAGATGADSTGIILYDYRVKGYHTTGFWECKNYPYLSKK